MYTTAPQIEFSVILTYALADQEGLVISVDEAHPSETQLLRAITQYLGREATQHNRDEDEYALRKISVCQLNCARMEDAMPWLLASGGKYYYGED